MKLIYINNEAYYYYLNKFFRKKYKFVTHIFL